MKGREEAAAIRKLFDIPTRSPLWSREGVFLYPPKKVWSPLRPRTIAGAWRKTLKSADTRDPIGVYIHLPSEMKAIADFFAPREIHPFLECLQREADILKAPGDLPLRTLYIGSGGAGSLSQLKAADMRVLFDWLRNRFRLEELEEAVAEVDASELTKEKVKVLVRGGITRINSFLLPLSGTEGYFHRKAFASGVALCRQGGIRCISIDMAAGQAGRAEGVSYLDAQFVLSLKPDAVHLHDYSERLGLSRKIPGRALSIERLRRLVAESQRERGPDGGPGVSSNNLQLFHASEYNASILGLGWGAVSHIRGALIYGHASPCFEYAEALLGRRTPPYNGYELDMDREMRAHLIRSLEDNGRIDLTTFAKAFSQTPEEVYPQVFRALMKDGKLEKREEQIYVTGKSAEARYVCSVTLYGRKLLRKLSTIPEETVPDPDSRTRGAAVLIRSVADRLNDEGVKLFGQGDIKGAVRRFERSLRVAPKNLSALFNLGACASAQDDHKSALANYSEAVRTKPIDPGWYADALTLRANALARLGRVRAAKADLGKALKIAPSDWPRRASSEGELKRLSGLRRRAAANPR